MQRLQVVVAHRPPFVFVTNTSSGPVYFSGLLVDLLNRILITSNVSYQYDIYVSPQNAGGTLSNGKWNGVIGELVAQRADIALFPLTRTASRLAVIDCTFSYYDAGLALLVSQEQTAAGPLSVLAPFSMTLWVTLLCTVVAVALLFWALGAYGRWIRNRQLSALRKSGVLSEKAVARARKGEQNPVLISFMAAAGAPERPGRNSWGVQVLYVVYCFFCLIVLSSYTANLTSYLAIQRTYTGINDLADLVKMNGLLGVNPNGSTAAYFSTSQDSLATQLQPNVRYCDSTTCVSWVRKGVVQAFVTDEPVLLYLSQQQPCDTAVVGDPFGPGNLVLGLQRNSSLLPLFNRAIQTFSEDGTLTSLKRTWFDGLSQCASDTQLNNTRLSVTQMLGAFLFLVMGIVVAFSIGTVENLKWCVAKAYARSYSESEHMQNSRSFTMRQSVEGQLQQPRTSLLLQQASRLRAATFRRLSVSLLGISHTNLPEHARTDDRLSEAGWRQHPMASPKDSGTEWPPSSPFRPPPPPRYGTNPNLRLSFGSPAAPYRRTSDPALQPRAPSGNYPPSAISAAASFNALAHGKMRAHHSHAGHFAVAVAAASASVDDSPMMQDVATYSHDGGDSGAGVASASAAAKAGGDSDAGVCSGLGRGGGCSEVNRSRLSRSGSEFQQSAGAAMDAAAEDALSSGLPLHLPSLLPMMPSIAGLRRDTNVRDIDAPRRGRSNLGPSRTTSLGCGTSNSITVPASLSMSMSAAAPQPVSPPTPGAASAATPPMSRMSSMRSNRVTPSRQSSAVGVRHQTEDGRRPPPHLQETSSPGRAPPDATSAEGRPAPAAAALPQQPQQRPQPRPPPLSISSSTAHTFPCQDDFTTFSEVSGSSNHTDDDAGDRESSAALRASLSFTAQAAATYRADAIRESSREASGALRVGTL